MRLLLLLACLPLGGCAALTRDISKNVSAAQTSLSYSNNNNDPTIMLGETIWFRDPRGYRK